MKFVLLIGIGIYFYSRIALFYFKKSSDVNNRKYYFFLLVIEVLVVCLVIYQLFINSIRWNLISFLKVPGIIIFITGVLISVIARLALGSLNWQTGRSLSKPKFLVKTGIYSWIRHPIYLGTWLMGIGFEIVLSSWLILAVIFLGFPFIWYCSYKEEKYLLKWFGEKYQTYKENTNWFIPIKRLLK